MKKESTKLRELPIFENKSFDITKVADDSLKNFRNGEKPLYNILKLVAIIGLGYAAWVYIIPTLFIMLGKAIATIGVGLLIILLIFSAPAILRWMRIFARFLHKAAVKKAPFITLYRKLKEMDGNRDRVTQARGTIANLRQGAEEKAMEAEQAVKNFKKAIPKLDKEVKDMQTKMAQIIAEQGEAGKSTDEYVHFYTEIQKLAGEARRIKSKLEQQKDFVSKYGMRQNVLQKSGHKLQILEARMEIQRADFQATIEILEEDYKYAQEMREATDAAKSALFFDEDWEREYALDIITDTVTQNIARTASNLNDIDRLIAADTYSLDDESIFEELDLITAEIEGGTFEVPEAAKYRNPDYIPTAEDRKNSGFGNQLF